MTEQEDQALDALLQHYEVPAPSANLMRATAELPLRYPRTQWTLLRGLLPLRRLLAGGALALSLGACAGYASAGYGEDATATQADAASVASLEADFAPSLGLTTGDEEEMTWTD